MRKLCLLFVYMNEYECECMKCMLDIHIERVCCVCGVCVCGGLLCDCKEKIKQKRKVLCSLYMQRVNARLFVNKRRGRPL
jgi:hypothetical protein